MVFANTVNTYFSYAFFHLLYKNHVVFNIQIIPGLGDVVTQFYLNFLNCQKLGCDTSPYTLARYFVPGSNFVRGLNEETAREERKNGVQLAPRKFIKFMHSGTSENALFK